MKLLIGMALGFLSGFMIYMIAAMMFVVSTGEPSTAFVLVVFLGGWAASTAVIVRHAQSLSKIFSRGALIGAAEWLAVIPAGAVLAGRTTSAMNTTSDAEAAGAALGGGIFTVLTGAAALFMSVACLVVFAVAYFLGREMKPENPATTRRCPECAEIIQQAARKCRFCGADLSAVSTG